MPNYPVNILSNYVQFNVCNNTEFIARSLFGAILGTTSIFVTFVGRLEVRPLHIAIFPGKLISAEIFNLGFEDVNL
jgi:hypothetical protein